MPTATDEDISDPDAAVEKAIHYAIWTSSISLAITLFCMTHVALLNRPLDKPHTLVVNSRWIRLAPRVPAVVLIMCLPLMNLSGSSWCGFATIIIYAIFLWETYAGLERGWRWVAGILSLPFIWAPEQRVDRARDHIAMQPRLGLSWAGFFRVSATLNLPLSFAPRNHKLLQGCHKLGRTKTSCTEITVRNILAAFCSSQSRLKQPA
jgi:hypothetical protein